MYIGVDIGGTKMLVAASNDAKEVGKQLKADTPKNGAQGIAEVTRMIEQVSGGSSIKAISVASAGVLNHKTGEVIKNANMHGWEGSNLIVPLEDHFKAPVRLDNDMAAAVTTEATIGAGKGFEHVLYVTLSTGIGAALIADGKLYEGACGLEAGHIIVDPSGPLCGCGGRGHFEVYASGTAIKKRYGKYGYQITDPKIWDEIAMSIAIGLHNFIVSYSPSVVVLGGGVSVHYAKFHEFLMGHLEELKPMFALPPIVQAEYIETCVMRGALILATRLKR